MEWYRGAKFPILAAKSLAKQSSTTTRWSYHETVPPKVAGPARCPEHLHQQLVIFFFDAKFEVLMLIQLPVFLWPLKSEFAQRVEPSLGFGLD